MIFRTDHLDKPSEKETTKDDAMETKRRSTPIAASSLALNQDEKSKEIANGTFPQKLIHILSDSKLSHAIRWSKDGKSFEILDSDTFICDIIPCYFTTIRSNSYNISSFQRKLRNWGFEKFLGRNPPRLIFSHPYFLRDDPLMCLQMEYLSYVPVQKVPRYIEDEVGDEESNNIPLPENETVTKISKESTNESGKKRRKRTSMIEPLPKVLLRMLSDDTIKDMVSWFPDGKSFQVFKKEKFTKEVLPKYFPHRDSFRNIVSPSDVEKNFTVMTNWLYHWGFKKVKKNELKYHHPLFVKLDPSLIDQIKAREKANKKTKYKMELEFLAVIKPKKCSEETTKQNTTNLTQDMKDMLSANGKVPSTIMRMLFDESLSETIAWMPNGKAFIINNQDDLLDKVLPMYFPNSEIYGKHCQDKDIKKKSKGFINQLHRYGFSRVMRGLTVFHHPLFRRDDPMLCLQMMTTKQMQKVVKLKEETDGK
ncbi:hypothetical protein CTEN210_14757 [Chaetoceros tenuissimus]|uniref:HSF-type DNA-binding domain-containing protein n=1 Tax=Chaetoceros tenuissimus TaxID=426638 RepID=A0AAD3D7T8_9STRA|nr:hypothetical protein CTEN210_14757 [Chaetoceros tenuissimus]